MYNSIKSITCMCLVKLNITNTMYFYLGLWLGYSTPLSTTFQFYRGSHFIDGGNWST